jgi:hypothetical protein
MKTHGLTGHKDYELARRRDWKHRNRAKLAENRRKKYHADPVFKAKVNAITERGRLKKIADLKILKRFVPTSAPEGEK